MEITWISVISIVNLKADGNWIHRSQYIPSYIDIKKELENETVHDGL